jgi:eukaryotic-like serine/threonine-protein kinase
MTEKLLNNHYLIRDLDKDKLGEGSFGKTYLARDTRYKSEQKVVVKHLQPNYNNCRSAQQREYLWEVALKFFRREAVVLEKLGRMSNQIPTLLDNFSELDNTTKKNNFYIVQEWIDGESLGKTLLPKVRLTQQQSIELMIEILEPLDFCHQEGAIHRDLKPDNLMRRRSNGRLVIIDFGAVREFGQLTIMPDGKPRTGSVIGTPGYMPFEQMQGSPVLASDVYAVGAIGMQAMTGMYPHEISMGAMGVPDWQKIQGCNSTPEFAAVLNQMLAVLHNARYFDAATALAALRPLRSGAARPTTPVMTEPVIVAPPKLHGKLSQELFTFETAKLEQVSMQKVEIIKKPGWLGFGEKEEHQVKTVQEWQTKKFAGKAERFTEDLGNGAKLEMVYVPAGSFTMGSEEYDREKPRHVVNVPGFYMGKYQVIQEQYLRVIGKNPAKWQDAKLPVETVSWDEAQVFCQKLSAETGKKYRLPSEAEWEYACRAGTDTPFYFGETLGTELANYDGSNHTYKSGVKGVYGQKTTPVGSFPANGFGLYDMHGNLWEWCQDKWHENYQGAPTNGSAWISGNDNDYRILRGGSLSNYPDLCRSTVRSKLPAVIRDNDVDVGFRIVCDQDL